MHFFKYYRVSIFLRFVLVIVVLAVCQFQMYAGYISAAEKGVLYLNYKTLQSDKPIALQGEWEFYFNELLTPSDLKTPRATKRFVSVPGGWSNGSTGSDALPAQGFGTYRLFIELDQLPRTNSMIVFKEVISAYNVWLNDTLIIENGKVGTSIDNSVPSIRFVKRSVNLLKGRNELVIQVSNFENTRNGFAETPILGNSKRINREIIKLIAYDLLIFGFLIIMAFYHLGLFLMRRKLTTALAFSLFLLVVAVRILVTNTFFINYLIPNISLGTIYVLSYFTFYTAIPMMISYIQKNFGETRFKHWFTAIYISSGLFCLSLFLPSVMYIKLSVFYQILSGIYISLALVLLFSYVVQRRVGALLFFLSVLFAGMTSINDSLYINGLINTGILVPLGLLVLFLGQSLTSMKGFSENYKKTEILSKELELRNKNLQHVVQQSTQVIEKQNEELQHRKFELERTNEMLRDFFMAMEQNPLSILITDSEGKVTYVNPKFCESSQYSKEEVMNKNPRLLKSNRNTAELYAQMWQTIIAGNTWHGEFINKKKNGDIYIEKTIISPVMDSVTLQKNFLSIKEDITETRQKDRLITEKNLRLNKILKELEQTHKDLLDSINYSKRLQESLIPNKETLLQLFRSYIYVSSAKEIISGDLFYVHKKDNLLYIAVGDSTANSIAGAFMTTLTLSLLHQFAEQKIQNPAEILENLRSILKPVFRNMGDIVQDGIDLGIVVLNLTEKKLSFSGANQTLYIADNESVRKIQGIRNPIGEHPYEKPFAANELELNQTMSLYLTTDGILPMFAEDKNFGQAGKALLEHLRMTSNLSAQKQKDSLDQKLEAIKQSNRHFDDITFFGIKLSEIINDQA